ncbi:MAG: malonyl-CoA--acyl carrier protein transacylase [Candidatus Binatus sp.]|nr:malonyl-CoA--acyl carrier protein transacylase [Candidatus Binatus sp.]
MKLAFLFPGQGSQRVGMGAELAANFDVARETFKEADAALGFPLSKLCFEGPEEELRLTANTQPAIVACSIAALRVLQKESNLTPEIAAGHSLGEYSALVASGALQFADAVSAVRERGRLMQEAVPAGQGAMAALIGLEFQQVREICEEVSRDGEIAVPANLNAPGQVVIAGHAAPVLRALEIAKDRGAAMSVELKVSAPFHCPLMQPARAGMEPVLAALNISPLKFGVIANVSAEVNRDPGRVVPLLLEQITSPVRWEESMGIVAQSGVTDAIEFGSGRVLTGLMRRMYRTIRVRPLEDPASLKTVTEALATGKN